MTLKYNVSGESRKQLVGTMAKILDCKAQYLGTPNYAYQVGGYTISRNGEVSFDAQAVDSEMLIEKLAESGFTAEPVAESEATDAPANEDEHTDEDESNSAETPTEAPTGEDEPISDLVVSMPMEGFDEASLERLKTLIASKYTLLQKALGTTKTLALGITGDRVCFPWFHGEMDADHVKAYTHLIVQMCAMAKNSKRITAKEKATDNDKYAFRCFLLRLGFIGDDYKRMRKILLKKLDGSSAFRNGAPKDKAQEDAEQAQNAAAPAHTTPTSGEASEVLD